MRCIRDHVRFWLVLSKTATQLELALWNLLTNISDQGRLGVTASDPTQPTYTSPDVSKWWCNVDQCSDNRKENLRNIKKKEKMHRQLIEWNFCTILNTVIEKSIHSRVTVVLSSLVYFRTQNITSPISCLAACVPEIEGITCVVHDGAISALSVKNSISRELNEPLRRSVGRLEVQGKFSEFYWPGLCSPVNWTFN